MRVCAVKRRRRREEVAEGARASGRSIESDQDKEKCI